MEENKIVCDDTICTCDCGDNCTCDETCTCGCQSKEKCICNE